MRFPAAKLRKADHFKPIIPGNVDLMSLNPNHLALSPLNALCPMPNASYWSLILNCCCPPAGWRLVPEVCPENLFNR